MFKQRSEKSEYSHHRPKFWLCGDGGEVRGDEEDKKEKRDLEGQSLFKKLFNLKIFLIWMTNSSSSYFLVVQDAGKIRNADEG